MKYHNIVKLFIGNGARWDPIRNTVIKTSLGNSLSKINTKTTKILKLLSKSQIGNPWVN